MNSPKKIGIWGSGVVGRSAIKYFLDKKDYKIVALADKKEPDSEFLEFLHEQNLTLSLDTKFLRNFTRDEREDNNNINFYLDENITDFLGIDLRKYSNYNHKWLTEADIFAANWKKPIIAITGTIGKTSIVTLLSDVLKQNNIKVATGSNIGTGMLDLLEIEKDCDLALLELSSFQLEHCKTFAPDLAIITNIFPNHLDRHGDMQSYIKAKFNIFAHQKMGQKVLLPEELTQEIKNFINTGAHSSLNTFFFQPSPEAMADAVADATKNTRDERDKNNATQNNRSSRVPDRVYRGMTGKSEYSISHPIPDISYPINWVIIFASCEIMGIEIKNLDIENLEIPDHRVEFVREFNGIEFYDDSKSTVCQATLAAVEKLKDKPIILFLGGISKGVDRSGLIKDLKDKVSQIICFGSEAEELNKFCLENSIPSTYSKTLEESFAICLSKAQTGSRVLFSPSGASFDLFKDYKDRGDKFKNLVKNLK